MLRFLVGLALTLIFQSAPALAYDCSALSAEDCLTSAQCILDKPAGGDALACRAAAQRCEIGYRQHFTQQYFNEDQPKTRCEARPNCAFQVPEQCYCPPIEGILCICGGGAPHQCVPGADTALDPPEGDFVISGIRRASDIASPAPVLPAETPVGQVITMAPGSISMSGMGCDTWQVSMTELAVNPADPNLSDLFVPQIGAPFSDGDGMILQSWRYLCEDTDRFYVTQIDARTIVVSFFDLGLYVIATRPLPEDQIKALQSFLASTKFYSGPIDGQMSDATDTALGFWLEERLHPVPTARFKGVTLTQNLLDRANVLNRP